MSCRLYSTLLLRISKTVNDNSHACISQVKRVLLHRMNSFSYFTRANLSCAITSSLVAFATAGTEETITPHFAEEQSIVPLISSARADSHAPLGVAADHIHQAGEWMLGATWMTMRMDGHSTGTNRLSSKEVFHSQSPTGMPYSAAALDMQMDMFMAHIMYAPFDWLTVSIMPQYVWNSMDMEMTSRPMMAHGHNGHGGHGRHNKGGAHSHSAEGWGDLPVTAIIPVWRSQDRSQELLFGLGVSIPTGSVTESESGYFLPYGMQLGSGTWDLLPSLTWRHQFHSWSYGAQLSAVLPLEEEGESGYRKAEQYKATLWGAYNLNDSLSFSLRVAASTQDHLKGHFNGPHHHFAPNHFLGNYGGDKVEVGAGVNFLFQEGIFTNHRIAAEVVLPVYQDNNGVGMHTTWSAQVGWQYAF